jgi:hypothetical protein
VTFKEAAEVSADNAGRGAAVCTVILALAKAHGSTQLAAYSYWWLPVPILLALAYNVFVAYLIAKFGENE